MSSKHDHFIGQYQEHKDKLFNYLVIRLNFDRALAEDLLMDVVLKAYEKFHLFKEEKGSFKTWIFTLTHNHLVNYWRDNQKKATSSLEGLEEAGVNVAITEPDNSASRGIENQKIQHILSLMKDSERELITLRYLQELEYDEISEIINKKEGTIRTALSRAMTRFEALYKKVYKKM